MKFFAALLSLLPFAFAADQLSYDPFFDTGSNSLSEVACSNGEYGMLTRGYSVLSDLPSWPYVGGAYVITGWDDPTCGTCWNVTYPETNVSITMTAIDVATNGFNVGENVMNNMTGGQAVQLGVVQVTAEQLNASACGL
ncbi:snodprot1 [Fistulina hepatica ATCC 64428]|uniref:Snodprot1 n=1 Tax=Fistulina hepatica ATCC 64428 TaxID=1128425 RepID=A0A0D7ALK2_9AGAR|nr:snodprot1 [Fistulina hepatica ATCC 64428]